MKIAVCIPTYNEALNIVNITKKVDEALLLINQQDAYIVNCDNNSLDGTNKIFNNINTVHTKVSLVDERKGKGINLLNFFNFCIDNNIDYAFTFDADLKSFQNDWILKYFDKLINGYDFVVPKYRRNCQEGNTTNHFIGPMLYRYYGTFIRQPIGGDYGFNIKYVKELLKNKFTSNILNYGIDIFMVVCAINSNMKIAEVELGDKVHNPSLDKMDKIFESVLRGFSEVSIQFDANKTLSNIDYVPYIYEPIKLIDNPDIYKRYFQYCRFYGLENYDDILSFWNRLLDTYLANIKNPNESLIQIMKEVFICRSVSFWYDNYNNKLWENRLIRELYRRK